MCRSYGDAEAAGTPLGLTPRSSGAFLDLGGFGASSSTLFMALPVNGNEAAIAYAATVSRRTIDPTRVALAFVSRRFVDVPADGANPLAVGYADALFICSLDGPRGDVVKARQQQLSPLRCQSRAARPGQPTEYQSLEVTSDGSFYSGVSCMLTTKRALG